MLNDLLQNEVGIPQLLGDETSVAFDFFRFNSFQAPEKPFLRMYLYYDTLIVQRQYERLIYDVPGFLSALGGSMGLYLGLSVLSILFLLMDAFPKMQDVLDKKNKARDDDETSEQINTVQ
jgi:hypothetical protein